MNWKLYSFLLILASFFSDASYQAYVRPIASFFKVELPEQRYARQEKVAEIRFLEPEKPKYISNESITDDDVNHISNHENYILNRLTYYYSSRLRV